MNDIPALLPLSNLKQDHYISSVERMVRHHDVHLDDEITEASDYRELISLLFNAGEEDTINLFINSPGGQLDTAMAIVEGIKYTQAHVTAILVGRVHSAASIISMYCHEVAVLDSAYSMVHTATGGSYGTITNAAMQAEFVAETVNKLLEDTYTGFLNKEELNKIKSGIELWFTADEIRKRMESRCKYLQTKYKKMQQKAQKDIKQSSNIIGLIAE